MCHKKNHLKFFMGILLVSLLISFSLSQPSLPANAAPSGTIWYVKALASGGCTSWSDACDLQTAISTASVDVGDEIWVASGYHFPSYTGDRSATFTLKDGVAIYGGFEGITESSRDQRDWENNVTILSGDINVFMEQSDNSYHVVTCYDVNADAVLDGFTIQDGFADTGTEVDGAGIFCQFSNLLLANLTIRMNHAYGNGGGMYNYQGNPTLSDVEFSLNYANSNGGGMYNDGDSTPTLTEVIFTSNTASNGGGMSNNDNSDVIIRKATFFYNNAQYEGGGMYNYGSDPKLTEVLFYHNYATNTGGGMANYFTTSAAKLVNVRFIENSTDTSAGHYGGGMYNWQSSPFLVNNLFNGNSSYDGGGIYNDTTSSVIINNTTFSKNFATHYGGGIYNYFNSMSMWNSILWGSVSPFSDADMYNVSCVTSPAIHDSLLTGPLCPTGATCTGHMLYGVPHFVDFDGADGIPGNYDDNLRLKDTSPAIDAGNNLNIANDDNDLDQDGNTAETLPLDLDMLGRILDNPYVWDTGWPAFSSPYVDMGAYESPLRVYLPVILR